MRDTNQTLRIVLGATLILAPVLLNEAHAADPRATPAATATVNVTSEPAEPELFDPTGPTLAITALAFSPDGKQILTGGTDGLTIVWDVTKAEAAHVFQTPSVDSHDPNSPLRAVRSVAFSGDGKAVLVGDGIDSAQLLVLPTGQVVQPFHPGHFVGSAAFS